MEDADKINKIEIRSEEVQEILGATPRWIVRAGISVIFIILFLILIGSYYFKYPDTIKASITLTTQNPPVPLKAKMTGEIEELFYRENEFVEKNAIVAVIESAADYKDIIELQSMIDTLPDIRKFREISNYQLGAIQQHYSTFLRLIKAYKNFEKLDFINKQIESLKHQIQDYRNYYERLLAQKKLKEEEFQFSSKQFKRQKHLFEEGVYSASKFEESEKIYLQEKQDLESKKTVLANTQMQINQLKYEIIELQIQRVEEENTKIVAIEEAQQNLLSDIEQWKKNYLVKAPISGKITFYEIWNKKQQIVAGDILAMIIPAEASNIIGKALVPSSGVGKIKKGQAVNIQLDNYPHLEFGLLRGYVKSVSLVPSQINNVSTYYIEVEIPDTLISNYGKEIQFSQKMSGSAEIITEDVRLIEKYLNPIKAIIKNNF